MKEQPISFKTAKLAKNIIDIYKNIERTGRGYDKSGDYHHYKGPALYPAITQSLLQKWFREERYIFINIHRHTIESDDWVFSYSIEYLPFPYQKIKRRCVHFKYIEDSFKEGINTYSGGWHTYEEALTEALCHSLHIIKLR